MCFVVCVWVCMWRKKNEKSEFGKTKKIVQKYKKKISSSIVDSTVMKSTACLRKKVLITLFQTYQIFVVYFFLQFTGLTLKEVPSLNSRATTTHTMCNVMCIYVYIINYIYFLKQMICKFVGCMVFVCLYVNFGKKTKNIE